MSDEDDVFPLNDIRDSILALSSIPSSEGSPMGHWRGARGTRKVPPIQAKSCFPASGFKLIAETWLNF